MDLLEARGLDIERCDGGASRPVLRGVDLGVAAGAVTVLLGETGAGKTLLARALVGLLPARFRVAGGRIRYCGRTLAAAGDWQGIRGREIFYAPQNAAACLNPVLTIGRQLRECSRIPGLELAGLLERLQLGDPGRVLASYPCDLSGGENQRCLLAMALASGAATLILDEPTAEIDADAQEEFVRVLREQRRRRSLAVLLITHHLGLIDGIADRVCVLSRGRTVAGGDPRAVFASPEHPYVREIAAYLSPG